MIYTRMLTQVNDGGVQEINIVMRKAPITWRPILNMSTISTSKQLLAHVIEHSKALIAAAKSDHNSKISTPELITALKAIGIEPLHRPRFGTPRSVNLVSGNDGPTEELGEDCHWEDPLFEHNEEGDPSDSPVQSAYQVLQKRQRLAPKHYYFPISDKETKLGKAPPSPCKVCSSPRHWDKECPYWDRYLEWLKEKTAQLAAPELEKGTSPSEAYQTAYQVLSQNQELKNLVNANEEKSIKPDFDPASGEVSSDQIKTHLMVMFISQNNSSAKESSVLSETVRTESVKPYLVKPKKFPHKHHYSGGKSAVGVSVLVVLGWIGNFQNEPVHLRHDSCADVSLISLEYYKNLVNPPSIRKGTKMNLWQLTDKDSKIEGYVSIPIFTLSEKGELIETEVEAYVVPQMSVPILLGEDYQLNYELTVKQSTENGVTLLYGDQDEYSIKATPVDKTEDFERLQASVKAIQSFSKAKNHRREKNRCKQKAPEF